MSSAPTRRTSVARKPKKPAEHLVRFLFENLLYFRAEDGKTPAIPFVWDQGDLPVFLVLGSNAGGKSFFRRLVSQAAKEHARVKETIHLSMQGRADGGVLRAMIYGSEEWQATGEITGHSVTMAIKTCRSREHDHLLFWDEPDLGLSEEAAAGVAVCIEEFARDLPEHTKGVFITTHSRQLVSQLAPLKPHYIHLGTPAPKAPPTIDAWLNRKIVPISPEKLKEKSLTRFRAIQAILNRNKPKT